MKEKIKSEDNLSGREEKRKNIGIWISGFIGLVLGATIIYVFSIFGILGLSQNKTLLKFKGGSVNQNELYEEMKLYSLNYALELADKEILDEKYKLTEEEIDKTETEAENILLMYQMYGYTEEDFLAENGFKTKEDFTEYIKFDHKRNLACLDYFKTLIPAEDIEKYYNENIEFGEINTRHMLVQISDEMTDASALKLANEIIAKLDEGKSFDDVVAEYKDKIISEDVDFDNFNADAFAVEYVNASKALDVNTYTKAPVKTSFGYHIIYCVNKTEKPSLEESTNDIVEILGQNLEAEDEFIRYKALIKLREDNGLKFKDKDLSKEYDKYCEQMDPTI